MATKEKKEETIVNVQEIYTRTELFVDRNRKPLFITIGAIAVIVIGFFAYVNLVVKPNEELAANSIWKAQQYFEIDSMDLALNGNDQDMGFEAIASEYSGSKTGKLAHYYLGVIYRDKGEYQTALDHFKEADFDDDAVGVLAMGNIGDMYIELGEIEEGAKWLEKAGKKSTGNKSGRFLGPVYMLKASKAYLELDQDNKAKTLLKEITEDYKGIAAVNTEYAEAAKLLGMLSGQ